MELHLKKNAATELMFPMVDKVSPELFKTGETVIDTAYYKDGAGAWTTLAITGAVTEIGTTGMYTIALTAAELNHDLVMVKVTAANSADSVVIIRTFVRNVDDLAYPTVSGRSLDITAGGCAGIDWGNIEATTSVVYLAGTAIGNVNSCTTNSDMRGTDGAALASNVPVNFSSLAITGVGKVTVGTNDDKAGYSISGVKSRLDDLNDFDYQVESVDIGKISGSVTAADNLEVSALAIVSGTAVAGTLSTFEMTTDLAESTNDHYKGRVVVWSSGVLKDQAAEITGYAGGTGKLIYTATTEAPGVGDTFVVV